MWRDNRYFVNQFPSWDDISKQLPQNDDDQKHESLDDDDTDDLMLISSLISSKNKLFPPSLWNSKRT